MTRGKRREMWRERIEKQEDERERDLRKEDIAEPEKVDEYMRGEDAADVVNEETLIDAPVSMTDIRHKSPKRKKATKRGAA